MAKMVNKLLGKPAKTKPVPVKIVNESPKAVPAPDYDKKWRAEDDLRALRRAAEVQGDAQRMKEAKAIGKKEAAVLARVLGK